MSSSEAATLATPTSNDTIVLRHLMGKKVLLCADVLRISIKDFKSSLSCEQIMMSFVFANSLKRVG